ncbi:hypothetical protein HNO89_001678 [Sporosarcina luteola]|nr:hypothetical protein [Sporosarcina luteola]
MIRFQKPLLFVQGPPVYTRIVVSDEESTSVFVMNEEGRTTGEEMPDYDIRPILDNESIPAYDNTEQRSHPIILDTLQYLNNPFRRQVYRPLQFHLKEKQLKGSLRKMEEDIIWIDPLDEEEGPIKVDIHEIESIHWRGQPFAID